MSKVTVAAAVLATFVLGACEKHRAPVVEPEPEPIFVEPVSVKG